MAVSNRQVSPRPIGEIAAACGIAEDELAPYGRFVGKVDSQALRRRFDGRSNGRYIAITGMTRTPAGEGKTLTAIGLSMAMNATGAKTILTLRQPSLGPVFGLKGGASGSGASQVLPSDQMNLHLTGDHHAVTEAHNLVAAVVDSQLVHDNPSRLDSTKITWSRVLDVNDRALRHIITGLGGREHGRPRETHFGITSTSEVMAVLSLAKDLEDLKARLGAMTVGQAETGENVTVNQIGVAGALTALLRDALNPNLLQTNEHTPVLVHTGPFANLSHGNSSVLADLMALKLADYTFTESGFGADLGFEKLIHLKCPVLGVTPDLAVLVCTVRALKYHSGHFASGRSALELAMAHEDLRALRAGSENLRTHIENIHRFGVPVVVAVNRFESDTEPELRLACELAREAGALDAQVSSAWADGSAGALDLARAVVAATEAGTPTVTPLVQSACPIEDKIRLIATTLYGASDVQIASAAARELEALNQQGLGSLPVCMAKTPLSLSGDARLLGRPRDFTLTVQQLRPSTGAGYVTAMCGDITTMPGLPRAATAYRIDVDVEGHIVGLT